MPRPLLHFTPPSGWLNDPNGLVYLDGEYHLFYQHHPASLIWGPMHWGHAVSRDLFHWEHLPIALAPDQIGQIFSGSTVIDATNTAGFGVGAMVAIFTHAMGDRQAQSLAYSIDRGRGWTKYAGNPVLAPSDAPRDFRDPRVLWYEGQGGGRWVMLLAVGQEIWFYRSPDLKTWAKTGSFGASHGAHDGIWECPELLSLPIDGEPKRRWVLVVGVQQGAPAGGSGTQYFVGDFDGAAFTSDDPPGTVRWADYGADFYAAQAWSAALGGRAVWLAWMNNWDYARETPATTWRGMMTAPRELTLTRDAGGIALAQRPARELQARRKASRSRHNLAIAPGALSLDTVGSAALEVEACFRVDPSAARRFGLRMYVGADEAVIIGYDIEQQALWVDDRAARQMLPSASRPQPVPLAPRDGRLDLCILVDTASLEIFADGGRIVLSNQIFPDHAISRIEIFAEGGAAAVEKLTLWEIG